MLKKVTFSIIKVVAILIVAAFVIAWLGFVVAGHAATPYIPMISPTPVVSGYLGFYSGIIALGIIPLILLVLLLFRVSWGYQVRKGVRRAMFGVWLVTAITFASTLFFSTKNFVGSYTETEVMVEESYDQSVPLAFNFEPSWSDQRDQNHFILGLDHAFVADGKAFIRDVGLEIIPTEAPQIKIVRSIHSAGASRPVAKRNMNYPHHEFEYSNNAVTLSDYYVLHKNHKFRNQRIRYMVHVPVGTEISFDSSSRLLRRNLSYDERRHINTKRWIMTADGLESIPSEVEAAEEDKNDS